MLVRPDHLCQEITNIEALLEAVSRRLVSRLLLRSSSINAGQRVQDNHSLGEIFDSGTTKFMTPKWLFMIFNIVWRLVLSFIIFIRKFLLAVEVLVDAGVKAGSSKAIFIRNGY